MATKIYKVELEIDAEWLEVVQNVTADVYDGEVVRWIKIEELS